MAPNTAADEKRADDVFLCPVCGQKHRGDLSRVREGQALRASCAGCRRPLLVGWKDGAIVVRLAAEAGKGIGRGVAAPLDPDHTRETHLTTTTSVPGAVAAPIEDEDEEEEEPEKATRRAARPEPRTVDEPPAAPAIMGDLEPGTRLGRYTIEEAIGEGGTGTVYRAFDPTTNRYVALKMVGRDVSEGMRQRFLREIEVQANLRHPHLMPVFERGEFAGRPYFAMELLYRPFTLTEIVERGRNGTLSRYATLRPLADPAVLVREVLIPVCEGIHVANVENGVVHRDLKPDNVLLDSRTLRPYVIDFGICHVLEGRTRVSSTVVAPTAEEAGIVGTPRFLAPEQARGTVHERTDVWGLGAILHFVLSGEPPIAAAAPISRRELARRITALKETEASARAAGDERKADLCEEKLARLEDQGLRTMDDLFRDAREGQYVPLPAGVPAVAAAIAAKAMAPRTSDRYPNARSLASDLQAWLDGVPTRAMAERGSSAASVVQGAGRAIRRHFRTAIVAVIGLAAGVAGAAALGVGRPATGGGSGSTEDVAALEARVTALGRQLSRLSPREAATAYDVLADATAGLRRRVADPSVPRDARAAALLDRFAPPRVAVRGPSGPLAARFEDAIRGGAGVEAKDGEAALAPGLWAAVVGDHVRLPVRVPFVVRPVGSSPSREPPVLVVEVPVAPESLPADMTLVVPPSTGVEHRGPPFSGSPSMPLVVAPFLVDKAETTNKEWHAFLESLADPARAARVPTTGFVAEPNRPSHYRVGEGLEDVPVRGVSPDDAVAYAAWRAKRDGAVVRLPTEAEWAAAAGVAMGWTYPCDWETTPSDADFAPPFRAASKLPSRPDPYGVTGLLGNVREIVAAVRTTPEQPAFLAKGAAAGDEPTESAIRLVRPVAHDARDPKNGLRLVRELR
jgi:serine/threonine protein kinase/formylglycine-generating enzyme required for sulfatase activity